MLIGVCGPPRVGKTTLIGQLATQAGSRLRHDDDPLLPLTRRWCEVPGATEPLVLACWAGFNLQQVVRRTLQDADLVIYLSRVVQLAGQLIDPIGPEDVRFFAQIVVPIARQERKDWRHIPWFYVLNKSDRGDASLLDTFVAQLSGMRQFRTMARDGTGIGDLWHAVQRQIDQSYRA